MCVNIIHIDLDWETVLSKLESQYDMYDVVPRVQYVSYDQAGYLGVLD